jgi:hypothetical protein
LRWEKFSDLPSLKLLKLGAALLARNRIFAGNCETRWYGKATKIDPRKCGVRGCDAFELVEFRCGLIVWHQISTFRLVTQDFTSLWKTDNGILPELFLHWVHQSIVSTTFTTFAAFAVSPS